jgi:hypothetical protein
VRFKLGNRALAAPMLRSITIKRRPRYIDFQYNKLCYQRCCWTLGTSPEMTNINFAGGRLMDNGSPAQLTDDRRPFRTHFFGQSSFSRLATLQEQSVVMYEGDIKYLAMLASLGCGYSTDPWWNNCASRRTTSAHQQIPIDPLEFLLSCKKLIGVIAGASNPQTHHHTWYSFMTVGSSHLIV